MLFTPSTAQGSDTQAGLGLVVTADDAPSFSIPLPAVSVPQKGPHQSPSALQQSSG